MLAAHFLRKYAEQNQKEISAIQQDALRRLQAYAWPGNVREWENVIERAVVLTQTSTVEIEHLPPHLQDNDPVPIPSEGFALPLEATLAEIERAAIEQALERSGGHRQTAARMLDIGSATMYRKLKEYGLE